MKKIIIFLMVIQLFCIVPSNALTSQGEAAILMDFNSEEILYEKNSEKKMFPASTTKIMTLILIYEALNNGQIKLNDMITTSAYAASMGGSQIYLEEGESMSVEDLLKSIIIASANDACVAFAQYLSGTSDNFVEEMNEKATNLKLKNTQFKNCTGLHDPEHYTCAYDLAIMAKYLLKIGGNNLLKFTTLKEDYIRNNEFWLVNTNKLLGQNEFITGLKTGYTKEAGYCLVSTATKNNQTLISVILNEPKAKIRNEESLELINYGFSLYKNYVLFKKDDIVDTIELPLTKEKTVHLLTREEISIPIKKDSDSIPTFEIKTLDKMNYKKGDYIGDLYCMNHVFKLYASNDVTPLNYLERIYEIFKRLV